MSDIATHLPKESKTVAAIFAHYKKTGDSESTRGYLGASEIGHPCERRLWYQFRNCCIPDINGRMYRLFATGDLEEARFIKDLRAIGCEVHDTDQSKQDHRGWPEQFAVSAVSGHFRGHMDGCALGIPEAPKTWHVLEFKTHNAKSFRELAKKGVKEAKPQHYAQMQAYMHLTGMKRTLYLARNKDTDELHSERIKYYAEYAKVLIERAERIIRSTEPLPKLGTRPDYYLCNWCDAKKICWGDLDLQLALPIKALSCRQCCHATPELNGFARWKCEKHERSLSFEDQESICEDHLVLPCLLPFATPVDHGQDSEGSDFIDFENADGNKWRHGRHYLSGIGNGNFNSRELMMVSIDLLTNDTIETAKTLFDGVITECSEDILLRYPVEDNCIIWHGRAGDLRMEWERNYGEDITLLTPIAKSTFPDDYSVVEFEGNRIAVIFPNDGIAEIRENVKKC